MVKNKLDIISGKAWVFGDDIDTGQIIPGKYLNVTDSYELGKHAFEDIRPDFVNKVEGGDIIVAGKNFGSGSSREHAPKALLYSGVSAIVAESFARIFYRNAINIGLFVVAVPNIKKDTEEGDMFEIDIYNAKVENCSQNLKYEFEPYNKHVIDILEAGGIKSYTLEMLKKEENNNV